MSNKDVSDSWFRRMSLMTEMAELSLCWPSVDVRQSINTSCSHFADILELTPHFISSTTEHLLSKATVAISRVTGSRAAMGSRGATVAAVILSKA